MWSNHSYSRVPRSNGASGFVHVYYGGGKGKTTSSIGLAVRAAGAGKRVLFLQFDKGFDKNRGEH